MPTRLTLAEATPGIILPVEEILFETVKAHCADHGIRPGAFVFVRGKRGESLLLQAPDGSRKELEADYAHFVRVSMPCSRPSPAAPSRAS